MENFEKLKKDSVVLDGTVVAVSKKEDFISDENPNGDGLMVEYEDHMIWIPREVAEYQPAKGTLTRFVGRPIKFVISDIKENLIVGDAQGVDAVLRDELAEEMAKEGVTKMAVIDNLLPFGAYVQIDGHTTLLLNRLWSDDGTTRIADKLKRGDKVEVKLIDYTEDKQLNIEAVDKYVDVRRRELLENFDGEQALLGTVSGISQFNEGGAVFVTIASGVDAIASIPEDFDVNVGDRVVFMLTQYQPEKNKVRGWIVRPALNV